MPGFVSEPEWWAVIIATIALMPLVVKSGRWLKQRWESRHLPTNTRAQKDRRDYNRLLQDYEANLTMLENLIVIRSQVEASKDTQWTEELQQQAIGTRDKAYRNLRRESEAERDMGIFQKMDALENRMVGIQEEQRRRAELGQRQAEIEAHRLFVRDTEDGQSSQD